MSDCFRESITRGKAEEEDDDEVGVLARCWGVEGTPEEEEISPADMAGPLTPSCSAAPSSGSGSSFGF